MSDGYTSKCSGTYWSNPPFKFFDILALWHSGLSAREPECQKIEKSGLDQYGAERFGRFIFATIKKSVGLKGLTLWSKKVVGGGLNSLSALNDTRVVVQNIDDFEVILALVDYH